MTITMTLVLWDIDGTLVDVKGVGRRAFARGIERAWGIADDLADVKFAGATDLGVLEQLRQRLALPVEHTAKFFEHMAEALEDFLVDGHASAVEGAIEAVEAFRARAFMQGLVTGNAKRTAYMKLRAAGVPEAFHTGAFGDEHADRNELAKRAKERAAARAVLTRVVLIGDTANDVRAAKHIGATAIALLRREEELDAIVAAGADHVVTSLREVPALVD